MDQTKNVKELGEKLAELIGELSGCTVCALEYITNENSNIDKEVLVKVMKQSIEHFNQFGQEIGE